MSLSAVNALALVELAYKSTIHNAIIICLLLYFYIAVVFFYYLEYVKLCDLDIKRLVNISPNSTWLVTSRLDIRRTTRSTCRARWDERVEPCCSTNYTQPKCMCSTRRTCRVVSRRDVTWRAKWNLGFKGYGKKKFVARSSLMLTVD